MTTSERRTPRHDIRGAYSHYNKPLFLGIHELCQLFECQPYEILDWCIDNDVVPHVQDGNVTIRHDQLLEHIHPEGYAREIRESIDIAHGLSELKQWWRSR